MNLSGKSALITGASRGLGAAIAQQLSVKGARVGLCATDPARLEEVGLGIIQSGGEARWGVCDLADMASAKRWANAMLHSLGGVDLLINNAGVLGARAPLLEILPESWDHVIAVNLTGLFYLTQAVLPAMIEGGGGCVVNVTSSVGRVARAGWGAYSVSKFGLEAVTQLLSAEYADQGIRALGFNPGATATDMRTEAYPEEDPATLPTAERVAETLIEMIEDPDRYPNGGSYDARERMG